jgi:peptide/nickel transport system ATP-binding protein
VQENEQGGHGTPLLKVARLDVSYSGVPALHDVSLELPKKGSLGIVGASGSGKSTLARAIIGLLGPFGCIDSGQVVFDGTDLTHSSPEELRKIRGARIGFVFQNPAASFSPIRRIGVQFDEALAAHGTIDRDEAEELLLQTFAKLGLPKGKRLLKSYPFELSGGMAQRVAIAMAIALRPALIIADEPTSALDVAFQAQVVSELMEVQEQFGTSLLLISHNIGLVAYACDEAIVMHEGRIVERARTDELLSNPEDDYTKALIAAVPTLGPGAEETVR